MQRRSMIVATGAALSAALLFPVLIGCNGEDYSSKDPAFASTNTGRFAAAGSTFIAPLFSRWSSDYEKTHHMLVNYRPIGSGAALIELKQGILTFAASDAALNDVQLKDMPPLVQIPVTAGPVCVIYNLSGLSAALKLTGKTLAGIYAGEIQQWDDASIARENPGVKLPHTAIHTIHRRDGSGTTNIFTTYLSAASESWAKGPGHGLSVAWPAGVGAGGSNAVLATVQQTPGTIGYVELNYAKQAAVQVASIQNKAGEFVAPSSSSAALAVRAFADDLTKDLRAPIVDPPASAKGAYPITGLSFILIPKESNLPGEQRAFKDFVTYCLTDGQGAMEEMSYTTLPGPVQQQGLALLTQLTENGKPLT